MKDDSGKEQWKRQHIDPSPESPEQADSQSSEYRCRLEKEPGEEVVNLGGESKRTHMNRLGKNLWITTSGWKLYDWMGSSTDESIRIIYLLQDGYYISYG